MRRSKHAAFGVVGITVAMGWLGAAWAAAQEAPFSGIVVEDSVQARAGAGRAFYPVGELKRGQVVTVRSMLYGWYEVDAPPGVFSYISKGFVDAEGDGSIGVVNSDNARIKAASLEGLPHQSYQVQLALAKGTKVQIAGESGDFYKIVPPKGAYVYLPPGAVRRATAAETAGAPQVTEAAAEAQATEQTTPQGSEAATARPTSPLAAEPAAPAAPAASAEPSAALAEETGAGAGEAATAPPTPAEAEREVAQAVEPATPQTGAAARPATVNVVEPQPQSPQVIEAEAAFARAKELPLEQQPVQELLARYEALMADSTLPVSDRRIVVARVYELRRNVELAGVLQSVQKTQSTMGRASAEQMLAPYLEKLASQKKVYTAVGRLMASALYDGRVLPRLYRLVDPGTGLTLVYVRPEAASPSQYLGRIVGVRGPSQYDQALNLQVVTANQIEPLAPPSE